MDIHILRQFKVAGVPDSTTITLDRNLPTEVRTEWTPKLYTCQPVVQEVGIENLKIDFPNNAVLVNGLCKTPGDPNTWDMGTDRAHFGQGYNAIYLNGANNCWVKNVTIEDSDSGVLLNNYASHNTLQNITVQDYHRQPYAYFDGTYGGTCHHPIELSNYSSYNLVKDCNMPLKNGHGPTMDVLSNGNVISGGHMLYGQFGQLHKRILR